MVEKEIKETKKQIKDSAAKTKEQTTAKVEELKDSAAKTKEQTTAKVEELKDSAEETKDQTEETLNSGRKQSKKKINDFLSSLGSKQEDLSKALADYTITMKKPLVDVIENDDEIIVKTDLPGVKKEDIDVSLTEDSVEITAQFEEEYNEEDINYIKRERNFGKTKRFIKLPDKVKVKDVTAKLEDSILTVTLPKLEKTKFKVDVN